MPTSYLMFLTELQTSFSIYKNSAEKKLAEIRHEEKVPSFSANGISKLNASGVLMNHLD